MPTVITPLFRDADDTCFACILHNTIRVLQPFLQEYAIPAFSLRFRINNKILVDKTGDLNKCDFIMPSLQRVLLTSVVHIIYYYHFS